MSSQIKSLQILVCTTVWTLVQLNVAMATDFVVPPDLSDTLVMPDDGDTLVVQSDGTIDTASGSGGRGVRSEADNQNITNYGTIAGQEQGINTNGSNTNIINHGEITSDDRSGVRFGQTNGVNNSVTNYGILSAGPSGFQGVYFSETNGTMGSLHNYGDISSSGSQGYYISGSNSYGYTIDNYDGGRIWSTDSRAIYLSSFQSAFFRITNHKGGQIWSTADYGMYLRNYNGYQNTIVNYGDIWSTVDVGLYSSMSGGYGNKIINYGSIRSTADDAVYISNSYPDDGPDAVAAEMIMDHEEITEFFFDPNQLINYGLIESTTSHGVVLTSPDRSDEILTNAGTIRAAAGFNAIEITDSMTGSTVNLLAGSVLEGGIFFGSPDDILNIGTGLNLFLDYDDTLENVDSEVPFIHDVPNTIVYTVDPSGFAQSQSFVNTTSGAIHQVVRSEIPRDIDASGGNGDSSTATSGLTMGSADDELGRIWMSGFGGVQEQDGSGATTGGDQNYGGFVFGRSILKTDTSYGGFAGASYSHLGVDNDTHEIDAQSVFAGLYGAKDFGGTLVSMSSVLGITSFDWEREVANNLVPGGLETARADYNGLFTSSSLTASRMLNERTQISAGGYYAGLYVEDYSESGSAANLNVGDRNVHVASLRAEAKFTAVEKETDTGIFKAQVWTGVDGTFNLGDDDVNVSINGLPLQFAASFKDPTVSRFVGLGFTHTPHNSSWSAKATVEHYGSHAFSNILGSFELTKQF